MKNDSYHYSGLSFTNITFKSGSESNIPTIENNITETGHSGNGLIRITRLSSIQTTQTKKLINNKYRRRFIYI